MATLYGSGKGLVRVIAGLQIFVGFLLFVFGIIVSVLVCHWTSKSGLGIWIGLIVLVTAGIGLRSCSVHGQQMISWYSALSILCALLSILLAISYGTAMADFYDELKSDTSAVDEFYSRQYVAVYMRTNYYEYCVSQAKKQEIEIERTGNQEIVQREQALQNKVLNAINQHGRKGLGLSAVFMVLAILEFVFACSGVIYACTAAGWLSKKTYYPQSKSVITIHHSRASGLL